MQAVSTPWTLILEVLLLLNHPGWNSLPPRAPTAPLARLISPTAIVYAEWSGAATPANPTTGLSSLLLDPEFQSLAEHTRTRLREDFIAKAATPEDGLWRAQFARWLEQVQRYPGCLSLGIRNGDPVVEPVPRPLWERAIDPLHVSVVVQAGDQCQPLLDQLQPLLALGQDLSPTTGVAAIASRVVWGNVRVSWTIDGEFLILSIGKEAPDAINLRQQVAAPSLLDNPRFVQAQQLTAIPERAGLVWCDFQEVLAAVPRWLGTQGLIMQAGARLLGADAFQGFMAQSGLDQGVVISRSCLINPKLPQGLTGILTGAPVTPAHLADVPADAQFVWSTSLSFRNLDRELKAMEQRFMPLGALTRTLRSQIESPLSLQLEGDIIPALGDVWTVYSSPTYTGTGGLGWVLAGEVRDPRRAYELANQIATHWHNQLMANESASLVRHVVYNDRTLFMVQPAPGELAPAWTLCVTNRQLLLAPHPQAMKGHLRFLEDRQTGRTPVREPHTGWQAAAAQSPGPWQTFAWADLATLSQGAVAALSALPSIATADDLRWHQALPSPRVFAGLGPLVVTARCEPFGLMTETRSALPVAWLVGFGRALQAQASTGSIPGAVRLTNGPLGAEDLPQLDLGTPQPLPDATAPSPAGPTAPSPAGDLLRSLIPPELQQIIPPDAIDRLQKRSAERKAERERRKAQRQGVAP